ncbi:hypothetical protein [Flavihumibacter sp. UBA7668]|uniref:hypothetical protein n=1 Tax=Flavihumibacter sp. UBA7668 TaxID=1946542 RepID=UPI0025BF9B78|nr:hypothetical protein [Flavihumibacter sp. UBA7668]
MSNYYLKDNSYEVHILKDDDVLFTIKKSYKMWGKTYCEVFSNTELVLRVRKLEKIFGIKYEVIFSIFPDLSIRREGTKHILFFGNRVYSVVSNYGLFKIWYDLFLNNHKVGELTINRKNWTFGGKWTLELLDNTDDINLFLILIGIQSDSGV